MAGIYDYINRFWTEAEHSPFNPTEVALYHYLLYEANRLRWNMPFACHTAILCVRLSTTKQNISKARQHLKERGLIEFQAGTGIRTPALYSLTLQLPPQLPQQVTPQLSRELTVQLTHSNIEDKDKNKDKNIINSQPARDDSYKSLEELESILLADTAWQEQITGLLAKRENRTVNTDQLCRYIRDFFDEQKIGGNGQRDESDCRSHFYHWIVKQLNSSRYGTKRKSAAYSGTDVTAVSAGDYEGAF